MQWCNTIDNSDDDDGSINMDDWNPWDGTVQNRIKDPFGSTTNENDKVVITSPSPYNVQMKQSDFDRLTATGRNAYLSDEVTLFCLYYHIIFSSNIN